MIKLAIFGDSWADPHHGHDHDASMNNSAWPVLIPYQQYQTDIYAMSGNSLYWAYQKFMEKQQDYDRCIFIVTSLGRYHKTGIQTLSGKRYHVPNYETANYLLETQSNDFDFKRKGRLQAFKGYYMHLQDDQCDADMARLMIDKIKQVRPDTIIVPICHHPSQLLEELTPLNRYRELMFNSIDPAQTEEMIKGNWNYKEINCICHVSKEINQLIANDMTQALASGVWDPQIPQHVKHEHSLDYYYELTRRIE